MAKQAKRQMGAKVYSTEGVDVINIDSAGNVGIGTGSPGAKLDVNGSIRIPASTGFQLGNGSTYFYTSATSNGNLIFGTSSVDRMTLDASGNVGIGTGSPGARHILEVSGNNKYFSVTSNTGYLSANNINPSSSSGFYVGWNRSNGEGETNLVWGTGAGTNPALTFASWNGTTYTERMRIDANGNALHNTGTAPSILSSTPVLTLKHSATGAIWGVGPTSNFGNFYVSTGTGGVFLAEGGTAWQAVSDERMKKNIKPLELGLEQIKALKPTRFDYIDEESENSSRVGFIAQEVLSVLPHAVHSPDDAEQMMGVSATEMIPVLVKAIQEQQAMIEDLKAEIEKLKVK